MEKQSKATSSEFSLQENVIKVFVLIENAMYRTLLARVSREFVRNYSGRSLPEKFGILGGLCKQRKTKTKKNPLKSMGATPWC